MKALLRGITINSFALWATSQAIPALSIHGGIVTVLIGGLVLMFMNRLVRPVLSLLTLPLNLITMGLFSWVVTVLIMYLLTVVVTGISISAYTFPGFSANGFVLPSYKFSMLQSIILVAFSISLVNNFFVWLFNK